VKTGEGKMRLRLAAARGQHGKPPRPCTRQHFRLKRGLAHARFADQHGGAPAGTNVGQMPHKGSQFVVASEEMPVGHAHSFKNLVRSQ